MHDWPWDELGIEETTDRTAIKRAYASKLKLIDRERAVDAFQALRRQYEMALDLARESLADEGEAIALDAGEDSRPVVQVALADERVGISVADATSAPETIEPEWMRDLDAVAIRLVREILAANTGEQVEKILSACGELDDLRLVDWFSYELCIRLFGNVLPWSVLQALSDRLGWDDLLRVRHWPRESIEPLKQLFRASQHEQEAQARRAAHDELIERRYGDLRRRLHSGDVPSRLRMHAWIFRRFLQSTPGWQQAFWLTLVPIHDVKKTTRELREFLGEGFADRFVPSHVVAFAEYVQDGGEDTAVSLAGWFGRAVGVAFAAFCGLFALQFANGWDLRQLWQFTAHIGLIALFIGAIQRSHRHALRERPRPLQQRVSLAAANRFAKEVLLLWALWLLLCVLFGMARTP